MQVRATHGRVWAVIFFKVQKWQELCCFSYCVFVNTYNYFFVFPEKAEIAGGGGGATAPLNLPLANTCMHV